MRKATAYLTALAVFAADQLSKLAVTKGLGVARLGDEQVVTSFFSFTYVENRGISLGLFQADSDLGRWLLVAGTAAIAAAVAWWIRRDEDPGDRPMLAMVLGGALGNILDRVKDGYVTDFLDLHIGTFRPFYVFNVADAAISIGVLALVIRALLAPGATKVEKQDHA